MSKLFTSQKKVASKLHESLFQYFKCHESQAIKTRRNSIYDHISFLRLLLYPFVPESRVIHTIQETANAFVWTMTY
jgi:hypothetical protein